MEITHINPKLLPRLKTCRKEGKYIYIPTSIIQKNPNLNVGEKVQLKGVKTKSTKDKNKSLVTVTSEERSSSEEQTVFLEDLVLL